METETNTTAELQHLFDTSARHILAQGRPGWNAEESRCEYKTAEGLRCAAAPFLRAGREDFYNSWRTLIEHDSDRVAEPLAIKYVDFVQDLQNCHDDAAQLHQTELDSAEGRAAFMRGWRQAMLRLAKQHNLSLAVFGEQSA